MRSLALATTIVAIVTAGVFAITAGAHGTNPQWVPDSPRYSLLVTLRAPEGGDGFGLILFRQPDDGVKVIYLDTLVLGLAPDHGYLLQRAVDPVVDGNCTSTAWLTLGKGLVPQAITTNSIGIGREELFRDVTAIPTGSEFDIHFRVIDAVTSAVVQESGCYRYAVRGS